MECLRRKVPLQDIYHLARGSSNNFTKDLAYYQDEELSKFVLKLSTTPLNNTQDAAHMVKRIRETATTIEERHSLVASVVLLSMKSPEIGTFIHTKQNTCWYTPHGKPPIYVSPRSEALSHFISRSFGLNPVDQDTAYVKEEITSMVAGLPAYTTEAKLSHYDPQTNRMMISTGAQVWEITPTTLHTVDNGEYGVLLRPQEGFLPFIARPPQPPQPTQLQSPQPTTAYQSWIDTLFDPFVDDFTNLARDEARALLATWFIYLFFKSSVPSRPILAIFGAPGAGKSTLSKRVATLLYGKLTGIVGVTNTQDFDQTTYAFPLVTLDNVDSWERWLPDRLAQSAGSIEVSTLKKYTDGDTFTRTRDAMLVLTAHEPKFNRPDVADRLIILRKKRFTTFRAESEFYKMPRATMWYQIMEDIQHILQTPTPEIPEQLRIQDFATLGARIALGLNVLPAFRSALSHLRQNQREFALQGDDILVDALLTYSTHTHNKPNQSIQQLYKSLEFVASLQGDPSLFLRKYRTPTALANRLQSASEALTSMVNITTTIDTFGRKLWTIEPSLKN